MLFRLPEVIAAVEAGLTVYIAEGEKDVLALEAVGEVATCNPMGAGKWRETYSKVLHGADVVIVQDRDDKGREHAAKVSASLDGIAASVRIVEAAEDKDAADHLAAGLSVDDFVRVEPDDRDDRAPDAEPAPARSDVTLADVLDGRPVATSTSLRRRGGLHDRRTRDGRLEGTRRRRSPCG